MPFFTKKEKQMKPRGSITVGRPKMGWKDDVTKDLKKMKVTNLKVAEDRRAWKRIIEKTKTLTSEIVVS